MKYHELDKPRLIWDNGSMRAEQITIQNIRTRIACEADAYVYLENCAGPAAPSARTVALIDVNLLNPANGTWTARPAPAFVSERRVWKCYDCRKQFSVLDRDDLPRHQDRRSRSGCSCSSRCAPTRTALAAREIERKYGV